MTSDIKALAEQRQREEAEKLEKADEAGRELGISFNTGTKSRRNADKTTLNDEDTTIDSTLPPTSTDLSTKPENNNKPNVAPQEETPKLKPPPPAPVKKPEPLPEKPKSEGTKPKG